MDAPGYPGGMSVEESGTPGSPAVVFIHGGGQSGREWRGHMAQLGGFHCLAPDLPGFGRSSRLDPASKERMADLLAELIERHVPAQRASVVGLSSAGVVIHALLARHPDRVERAVIDGSPPYDMPRAARAFMRPFMTALSPFIHTRPVLALFRDTHDSADLRVASRKAFRLALAESLTASATVSAACPTLLVTGEKDRLVRPTNAALASLMPVAEAWYAPGLDHCWQRKAPDLHIRMVEAWVSGQELPSELKREPAPRPETVERVRAGARPSGPMFVQESGNPGAPAVLFIHGLGQSSHEWSRHMASLGGFHCLAPDLPGHGRSSHLPLPSNDRLVDDLAEVIASRVPAGRAHVVGISWGAFLLQLLMERHPDRVDRAVADGLPLVWPRGARSLMLGLVTLLVPFLHTRPVLALYRDIVDAADLRIASRRAFWQVWAVSLRRLTAATEAPCPTLLVAGEKEGFTRPGDAALATLMPHAEARYAPGLDHCWQRKAPDLHIRMVEAWLTGQPLPSELRREPAATPEVIERLRAEASPGGGMYVEESGTRGAPAILFVHGMGQSSRIWRDHMAALPGFHCLAPDLPGFGRSNRLTPASNERIVDLLAGIIATMTPARCAHVVGLSWGATLTLELLRRYPGLVERAIADGAPIQWPRGSKPFYLYLLTAVLPFKRTGRFRALFGNVMDEADLRDASRLAFWRAFVGSMGPVPDLADAPAPTLLVAGEREGLNRLSNAALAALMPQAEARYAPGLGHCWQRKDPGLHIRTVEAWVTGRPLPSELRREPAPSPEMVERVRAIVQPNWYLAHERRITFEMRFASRHYRKHLAEAYGKDEASAIIGETMQRFEVLLAELPYIGGDENPNTMDLYTSAAWLAMYRSLQARGASVEEAARLIYRGAESFLGSVPMRWIVRWQGRRMLGGGGRERVKRTVARSQQRRYPEDWVYEFVDRDGHDFEFGMDCTECAIVKYLAREGAPELAPYLCWIDYPAFAAAHLRLTRTETIAQGGQCCDFRFGRGEPVAVEPEFLRA